ncbi:MAG TPA: helix-turn-helix transcriptional regulator [Albitalea sp.]|uniref:helix-turn-helix transcriptional regulator n=1 Tax=Piscinibacter sp. TaxID=1903157 RepID=UPI002ED3C55A
MNLNAYPAARSVEPAAWAAAAHAAQATLLMRMLDEIDYGLLLLGADGRLRYANQLGLRELAGDGPLQMLQGQVRARLVGDQSALHVALLDACRGRRRLFSVGAHAAAVTVAVVPMPADDDDGEGEGLALLVFGKRRAAETLTLDFYARTHGLTGAETSVLRSICGGMKPKEIARAQGVAISTVRSHICSIRTKTQTSSIRELANRIAVLPPITPAMKTAGASLFAH